MQQNKQHFIGLGTKTTSKTQPISAPKALSTPHPSLSPLTQFFQDLRQTRGKTLGLPQVKIRSHFLMICWLDDREIPLVSESSSSPNARQQPRLSSAITFHGALSFRPLTSQTWSGLRPVVAPGGNSVFGVQQMSRFLLASPRPARNPGARTAKSPRPELSCLHSDNPTAPNIFEWTVARSPETRSQSAKHSVSSHWQ